MNTTTIRNRTYTRLFSLDEVKDSPCLQWLYYILLISFFISFYGWISSPAVSTRTFANGEHVCPPYFPTCGEWYFLLDAPWGYSQAGFYVLLFLVLLAGAYAAWRQDWANAHRALLVCYVWKLVWGFALTYGVMGNFDYYDLILATAWLLLPHKLYFTRLLFVWMYFMASTAKIHEGWILGNYFTALLAGAPLFSNDMIPYFTNVVIVMQMAGSWFLLSKQPVLRNLALAFFLLFHIYSGVIVQYRYITISIPALLILFAPLPALQREAFAVLALNRQTLAGYLLIGVLLGVQLFSTIIPGDQKKTLEGAFYGMYMFDANHQCISRTVETLGDGHQRGGTKTSFMANRRCDPYREWFELRTRCQRDTSITSVAWTYDHAINGHPFERIVDTPDACKLVYDPFHHNVWIRLDGEAVEQQWPVYRNGYGTNLDPDQFKIPASPREATWLELAIKAYWSLWCFVLFALGIRLMRDTRK
jgi:hypothetical protein